jgi:hypothetical protein
MHRERLMVRLAIERLRNQCDSSALGDLLVIEARLIEADDRARLLGKTEQTSSDRREAFYAFNLTYDKYGLDRIVPLSVLEADLDTLEKFEALTTTEKYDYYLTRLADDMQFQLRSHRASDVMYVPLHASYLRYGEAKAGKSMPRRGRHTRLIERIVDSDDSVLIVRGLPGTGKSVAMRQVVRTVAMRTSGRATGLIPIFIPLGQLGHIAGSAPELMLRQISTYLRRAHPTGSELALATKFLDDTIPALLKAGRCMFIFDGMDELPKQGYDETCRHLLEFSRHWSDNRANRFIFSCREFDYPKELRIDSLVIFPFEWPDVDLYLRHQLPQSEYVRRRQEARVLWDESRTGRSMLDNPFFLHLTTRHILDRPNDAIPANRGPLFDAYVDRVFRIEGQGAAEGESALVRRMLEDLALWLTVTKASGTSASLQALEQTLDGGKVAVRLRELRAHPVVPYFIDLTPETVTFRHHRLREFFAALALKRRYFGTESASA